MNFNMLARGRDIKIDFDTNTRMMTGGDPLYKLISIIGEDVYSRI